MKVFYVNKDYPMGVYNLEVKETPKIFKAVDWRAVRRTNLDKKLCFLDETSAIECYNNFLEAEIKKLQTKIEVLKGKKL